MTWRTRVGLAATLLTALVALSGCVRLTSDLTLSDTGTVSGEVVVAVEEDVLAAAGADVDAFQQHLVETGDQFGLPLDQAAATPYRADGFAGSRYRFDDVAASEFDIGSESAIRQGPDGSWEVRFVLDDRDILSDARSLGLPAGSAEIDWQVRFPYEVVAHNGTLVDPGTVRWQPDLGSESVLVFRARTNATPVSEAGDNRLSLGWAVVGGVVALVVIAVGGWFLTIRQRRDRARPGPPGGSGEQDAGAAPGPDPPPAPQPDVGSQPFDHSAN